MVGCVAQLVEQRMGRDSVCVGVDRPKEAQAAVRLRSYPQKK